VGQRRKQAPGLRENHETLRFTIFMAIALAACAGAVSPSSTPPASPLATPAVSPVTTPIAPPEPSAVASTTTDGRAAVFSNTIIVYQREGGIAGLSNKWTFYHTGRIVAGDGTEWQVPAEQVKPLFDLAESPDFWNLNDYYSAGVCADCYVHTLTVYQNGEVKTVTFVEGADLPDTLQQMLNEINKLISH
jgi:hypothetical protein